MRVSHALRQLFLIAVLSSIVVSQTGCQTVSDAASSAYRSAYYATVGTFGVHKRDILKKKVTQARDEQKETGEEFKDALTKLREIYSYDGGELGKQYKELNSKYESAAETAATVKDRIESVETVANDLFKEWESELEEIKTMSLKVKSKKLLVDTRGRYQTMVSSLKKAETSMGPVLQKFKEHVTFLKHNLNAAAIASLKGEALNIQGEIGKLIDDMNASIKSADDFIKTL
ncbi:MAG: DNA repair protein [Verrucomicrobiales bacterium]|nr:DNA repair protein [Verrucomicrobiales bacterium]